MCELFGQNLADSVCGRGRHRVRRGAGSNNNLLVCEENRHEVRECTRVRTRTWTQIPRARSSLRTSSGPTGSCSSSTTGLRARQLLAIMHYDGSPCHSCACPVPLGAGPTRTPFAHSINLAGVTAVSSTGGPRRGRACPGRRPAPREPDGCGERRCEGGRRRDNDGGVPRRDAVGSKGSHLRRSGVFRALPISEEVARSPTATRWVALARGGAKIRTASGNASMFFPIRALRPPGSSYKGLSGKVAVNL
jgi:hypothetical protein